MALTTHSSVSTRRRMYRVALRILGDPVEAEDAVQGAWVSAWRSLDTFRNESAVSTWLYRIVTNSALARVRRRRPTMPLDTANDIGGGWLSDPHNRRTRSPDHPLRFRNPTHRARPSVRSS